MVNQPIKSPPNALDAAWETVLSTLRSVRGSNERTEPLAPQLNVTLLTGFLGSGKTTLLRHLLENSDGLKIAVVMNDVGAVEVDARLIRDMTSQQISLANGCVCCALSDDLSEQLQQLSAESYDVALIEASGVSDPVNISQVIEGLPDCRLDGIVAVVDPISLNAYLNNVEITQLLTRQIQTAHLVLVSKEDLVDELELQQAIDAISAISPGCRIISISEGSIDPSVVLSAALKGISLPNNGEQKAFRFATSVVSSDGPWSPVELGRLLDESDHRLLRGKGWFADYEGSLHELQIVGRRWSINEWVGDAPREVVLISVDQADLDTAETMFRDYDRRKKQGVIGSAHQ